MEEEDEDLAEEEDDLDVDVLDADVTGMDSVDMEDTEDMVDMVDTTLEIIWIWMLPIILMWQKEFLIILN